MKFIIEPEVELLVGTSHRTKKDDKSVSDFIKKQKAALSKTKKKIDWTGIAVKTSVNPKTVFAKKK